MERSDSSVTGRSLGLARKRGNEDENDSGIRLFLLIGLGIVSLSAKGREAGIMRPTADPSTPA